MADGRPVASYHPREVERLGALCAHGFHETESEPLFDRIAAAAALVVGTPIAFVNVVRGDDQISVGQFGFEPGPFPRDESFCAHTIVNGVPLVVPDTRLDPRFASMTAVAAQGVRFYAGVPVADGSGLPLGSLCAVDFRARELAPDVLGALVRLATLAGTALDVRRLVVGSLGPAASPFDRATAHDALAASFDPLLRALEELGGGKGAGPYEEEPARLGLGSAG